MENQKTPKVRIPPKRGQVKARMFKQLVNMVSSVVTPGKQGGGGGDSGSSASTTPPPSSYPSEGHSDA
ncbi:hypothetical protein PTKIN_Ptkin16aG0479200 [Pterospermum kingtungense]